MSLKQIQQQQQQTIHHLSTLIAQKRNPKRPNLRTHPSIDINLTNPINNTQSKKQINKNSYNTIYQQGQYSQYIKYKDNKQKESQQQQQQQYYHNKQHKQKQQMKQTIDDVQQLDVSDLLKTVSHQKKVLTPNKRQQMYNIHYNLQLTQDDYKYFMMIISQANYRKLQYPGYYQQILKQINKYPQIFFICIKKDIPRTMPDQHPLQQSLKNVLYTYAIRNPSLLYCQGMNYLVGFLLINKFSQQQTYWFLVQLIQDIVMPDYFKDLSTISMNVQIFQDIMNQVFPQLAYQMNQVGMESSIFLVGWYICLFTKGFINSVSQFLLQQIVLQSYKYPIGFTLIRISLGIFATLFTRQQRFQFQQKDFKSLKQSIQSSVYQISLDQLKIGLNYFQFDYQSYNKLIQLYRKRKQKVFVKALQKQLNQKKISLPICSIDKPVCIQRVQIQKKIGTIQQVLILKNNIPIQTQLIQNYFINKQNKTYPKISYQFPQQCPITHHSHICHLANTYNKIMPHKKLTQQNQKYNPIHQGQCSIQFQSRFSKIQDRFSQLSQYFVIQANNNNNNNIDNDNDNQVENQKSQFGEYGDSQQQKQKSNQNQNSKKQKDKQNQNNKNNSHFNFVISVGNVFKKAFDGLKMLRSGLAQGNMSDIMAENTP